MSPVRMAGFRRVGTAVKKVLPGNFSKVEKVVAVKRYLNVARIKIYLNVARKSKKGLGTAELTEIVSALDGNDSAYKKIGTSKEELRQLFKKGYINMAKQHLDLLRKGHKKSNPTILIGAIMLAKCCDATYKEMKTTEKEIEELTGRKV